MWATINIPGHIFFWKTFRVREQTTDRVKLSIPGFGKRVRKWFNKSEVIIREN